MPLGRMNASVVVVGGTALTKTTYYNENSGATPPHDVHERAAAA
jgi:hypothetical protein